MNLPEKYLDTMKEMLGDEFDAYLESFNDSRLYGLRVNTLKISVEEFLKINPFHLEPIPWIDNGFYFSEEDKPSRHPFYFAGLYYIQEPSAMTPANVLPVCENDIVFDMCAAPGGKSTELGAKLNHTGVLVTNDISNSRAKALLKNVEVFGIPNVFVLSEDPKNLVSRFHHFFDKVLIDAPCSGEGMFRKDNKLMKSWSKNGPEFYHEIQKSIILNGADMLRPGGMMLYSTCTFSKLEDEESIRYLLANRPEMSLVDIVPHSGIPYEGFSHGFEDSEDDRAMQLRKAVRIWPHKMQGEGHFVALFQKSEEEETDASTDFTRANAVKESMTRSNRIKRAIALSGNGKTSGRLPSELIDFINSITLPIDLEEIQLREERVFVVPRELGSTQGLRAMRTGLLLGELKKNRFEPSQALAMVLKADQCDSIVDLSLEDDNVLKYLKGETIEITQTRAPIARPSGWQLVCVEGYPLGWGKLSNGTLKNKYLAGWRMQ